MDDSVVGFESFQAGTGNDYIYILAPATSNAILQAVGGGGGSDTLSFEGFETGISISLATGSASFFAGSLSQFENVIGTHFDDVIEGNNADNILVGLSGNDQILGLIGNDLLIGGVGNDLLYGGAGRDLLIGGAGSDWLYGGSGDDIIISGTCDPYDNSIDFAALSAIMSEWTSNRSYSQRINRLRNGVGPGNSIALNNSTIQSDGEIDHVFGEGGDDWFWLGTEDLAPDRLNGERLN